MLFVCLNFSIKLYWSIPYYLFASIQFMLFLVNLFEDVFPFFFFCKLTKLNSFSWFKNLSSYLIQKLEQSRVYFFLNLKPPLVLFSFYYHCNTSNLEVRSRCFQLYLYQQNNQCYAQNYIVFKRIMVQFFFVTM